jgi:signal transduction protein with GAF and PtsI domain
MRVAHAAALTAAALLLASFASAQGIGDVAAREKEKKKQARAQGQAKPAKVYTETDLGQGGTPAAAPAPEAQSATAKGATGKEGAAAGEKTEEDQKAAAEAAWRTKLEQARKEAAAYQETADKVQLDLNDMSGGAYSPTRANKIAFLEQTKQKLADAQGRIAALEEEGRRSGYR